MGHVDSESVSDVMRWLQSEAAVLWPAFLKQLNALRCETSTRPASVNTGVLSYRLASNLN